MYEQIHNQNLIYKTLRKLKGSKHCIMITPQGWGVYIVGVNAKNPDNRVFEWRRTQVRNSFVISDYKRILLVSDINEFVNEDPNWVFLDITKDEHPYRLEWRYGFIPTALLGWWIERMKTFLYPFHDKSPIWWEDELMVRIQYTYPRTILMDGEYIFEPLHPLY